MNESGIFGAVEHFWSLGVEEHFCLMWPWIVHQFDWRRLMRIPRGVGVIALVVRAVMAMTEAPRPAAASWHLFEKQFLRLMERFSSGFLAEAPVRPAGVAAAFAEFRQPLP